MGRLLTVDRDDQYHFLLFAPRPESARSLAAFSVPHRGNSLGYRDEVVRLLQNSLLLTAEESNLIKADSEEDGVFAAGPAGARLYLNLTAFPRNINGIEVPALSITRERRDLNARMPARANP
jgi:hypothetical protein